MGAGDEFIVTGQARELHEKDPTRKIKIVYEKPRWHPLWDHNPRLLRQNEKAEFTILRPRDNWLRPYCSAKSAERWTWRAWKPPIGEIYFTADERNFAKLHADQVVIEPNIKNGASPNKRWPLEHWTKLIAMLNAIGIRPVQLGPAYTSRLPGTRFIETQSIRLAAAVLSRARGAVLTEGALHHIAAGVNTPTVVIFGGYISPEVTGYGTQRNLFTGEGLGCGWRTPCKCCADAMQRITPAEVMTHLGIAMAR